MAKLESVVVSTKYCFIFIPFATYERAGKACVLTVFGLPIYKRAGDIRSLFGIVYHAA